jgi:hypothetical protein
MRISWKIRVLGYAVAPLAPPVATLSKEAGFKATTLALRQATPRTQLQQ